MQKDFDTWNAKKKIIDTIEVSHLFHEGEVWWTHIGLNIGDESCGKGEQFTRPVIIWKKLSARSAIVIPLTTQRKEGSWFVPLIIDGIDQWGLLHQIRSMSSKRFQRRLATLDDEDITLLSKKLQEFLKLGENNHPLARVESVGKSQKVDTVYTNSEKKQTKSYQNPRSVNPGVGQESLYIK